MILANRGNDHYDHSRDEKRASGRFNRVAVKSIWKNNYKSRGLGG